MNRRAIVLAGCFLALVLLWIPGFKYPIVSDTAFYALLGENVWAGDGYALFGEPYAKHMPLHAVISYPLVRMLGYTFGMKVNTLLAGFGVIAATYILLKMTMSRNVALGAAVIVTFHHAFALMTQLGSADLPFAALFLFSLAAYIRAGEDRRWYLGAFLLAGLASLARYNGAPLFLLFLGHAVLFRRGDLRGAWFWGSAALGAAVFGLWFLRNASVFGNPFHSAYMSAIPATVDAFLAQIVSNALYYAHPLHNILPILLMFAIVGLLRHWKEQGFLIAAMLTAWALTSFWTTQAMRFAFPGYPILLGFAVLGMVDSRTFLRDRFPLSALHVPIVIGSLIVVTHAGALCLYTYGECNAWFDENIGWIEKDLGLTPEGFYAWHRARQWVRANAPLGATVRVPDHAEAATWESSVFRKDIQILSGCTNGAYRILQNAPEGSDVIFTTAEHPRTHVIRERCTDVSV